MLPNQLDLQEEIIEELALDPRIVATDIAVSFDERVVALSGSVPSLGQKHFAEEIVKNNRGVRGVVTELTVELPAAHVRGDKDIARAIAHRFATDGVVPADVRFVVENGHVTLSGAAQWYYQAHEAVHEASRVTGVLSVTNQIIVRPAQSSSVVSATQVRSQIEKALRRASDLDASRIGIAVRGSTIILSGVVPTWLQHDRAAKAAWSVPGISRVDNCIAISAK